MKWRVVLTVLFVLTLFAGFAYLYVNTFVRKQQHAVILFVVNGLDLNTLNLARQQLSGTPMRSEPDDPLSDDVRRRVAYRSGILNLDSFWNMAILGVREPGHPVPDEGADATALACGQRVENGLVAINSRNQALTSLIYAAEQSGRATGLVTTSSLVDPTPVAFYSTINGKPDPYRNAMELLLYSGINVIFGGGEQYFTPVTTTNEWGRTDGRNLLDEARDHHYAVLRTRDELHNAPTWPTWPPRKLFGLFAEDSFYYSALRPDHSQQPSLAEMTRVAISSLNHNYGTYFLVVQHSLVARAAERNLTKLAVNEVAEVDEAIQSAIEYAGPDALILVTDSYSLGAVGAMPPATPGDLVASPETIEVFPAGAKPPVSPVAPPSPFWLTGPGGPVITREQAAWLRQRYEAHDFSTNVPGLLQPQPAYRFQTEAMPTSAPAWLASRGEGASQLRGFFNNADLYEIISDQF